MAENKKDPGQARKRGAQAPKKTAAKTAGKMPAARRRGSQSAASKATKAATPRKTAQQAMKMAQETAKAASEAVKSLSGALRSDSKKSAKKTTKKQPETFAGAKLKVISLGGLNEIGKNMTVLEYGQDMIVIDAGMTFPDEDLLGVDMVIPDITYLQKNKEKLRGIFLTHAHEDHIGALPYVLRELQVPVLE